MRWLFLGVLTLHGFIHFLGFAKAFGLMELPQLGQAISRGPGVAWLAAGAMHLVGAVLLLAGSRHWWVAGFLAVLVSQIVIISSWQDAKFGTVANLIILAGVAYGFASSGPLSFSSEYRREVAGRLPVSESQSPVTESDLSTLPEPVGRYVRLSGAVGRPRVEYFSAEWRGRIRATADDSWMPFRAEQTNFTGDPARFFLLDARKGGLPVDVFHAFRGGAASMGVRLLSIFSLARASGPELTRAETVTLLNDLSILAPGGLIDPAIRWESIDAHSAAAEYTVGVNTVRAILRFNDAGELVDFVSDDRLIASPDGREFTRQRWSTPVVEYRDYGPRRAASRGEGRWHPAEGSFVYIELELLSIRINGAPE
jgi:uncharacterized membrane protein YphA (DoxX/SURF4 family)